MASIAQEESRSISQNVTWGKRASFQQGKVSFAYMRFLGYKKNNKIVIDEDEAVIVKLIYRMFLVERKSITGIVNHLTKLNVKTPSGKSTKWTKNTLNSRFIHQCNRKFEKGKDKCTTPNLTDSEIKHKFIEAYNIIMQDKKRIIDDTNVMIALLTDTTQIDNQIDDLYRWL